MSTLEIEISLDAGGSTGIGSDGGDGADIMAEPDDRRGGVWAWGIPEADTARLVKRNVIIANIFEVEVEML